jgi:predicted acetyltransferase
MWIWPERFAGTIGIRWQHGTPDLPPTCAGHIGYSVVPWERGNGYATAALREMLPLAREVGLPYVDLTTDEGNVASQRVIVNNGGTVVERYERFPAHDNKPVLRWRILL